MICCESIIQMLGTWHFILTLDDFTSHYIITTSAPLDLLKNTRKKNNLSSVFKLKLITTYHTWFVVKVLYKYWECGTSY